MAKRMQAVSQDSIKDIAMQPGNVVYEPVYDNLFEPWAAARVKKCVYKLAAIARNSSDQEQAQKTAREDNELKEFAGRYEIMFKRLSEPEVSKNEENVGLFLMMIDTKESVRLGTLSETDGKQKLSDAALATLLRQSPNAPAPPADLVEEL